MLSKIKKKLNKGQFMNAELTTIETKNLIDFLTLPEQDDFYDEGTQKTIAENILQTMGLVYPINDEGEKQMNADATAINKYASALDKTAAAIFKRRTESANTDRSFTKRQVEQLQNNRKSIISQFEEEKRKRLAMIGETLKAELIEAWEANSVGDDFRFAKLPEAKESQLTPTGKLTSATKSLINNLAQADFAWQSEINSRNMTVELECRRAGIDTPFSPVYIGTVFHDKNRQLFDDRLKSLIDEDARRKLEQEEKLRNQLEAENQKKLAEALKAQQSEADRVAKEKAQAEAMQALENSRQSEPVAHLTENLEKQEPYPTVIGPEMLSGKLIFTATFLTELDVESSRRELIDDFLAMLPKELFDRLQTIEVCRDC
jgi:hypothetical protein